MAKATLRLGCSVAFVCSVVLAGCEPSASIHDDSGVTAADPQEDTTQQDTTTQDDTSEDTTADTAEPIDWDERLAPLLEAAGAEPIERRDDLDPNKIELGRMLFFDPILSGNRDTACVTCHRLDEGTTVHRSFVVGTKAVIRDGKRMPGPDHAFLPRNPPTLFNLGEPYTTSLLWDGRVTKNSEGHFVIYDKGWEESQSNYLRLLSPVLDDLLAAQTMMPVLPRDEMRGDYGELDVNGELNELAQVPDHDLDSVWMKLTERLLAVEGYRELFEKVYPDVPLDEIEFAHATNAFSAFFVDAFTHGDSPFDGYLRGDEDALTEQQKQGAYLFFGEAGCAKCHTGPALTDEKLYNIGVRPIGSGPDEHYEIDLGAVLRSHAGEDKKFAFRTPSLRNVELSGPWMHNGAYTTLEAAVRHHLDPKSALWDYDVSQLDTEFQRYVHTREEAIRSVEATLEPMAVLELSDAEVDALVAFLESLTSPSARDLGHLEPESVPSGLAIPDP
ncbi:cytochrome-c peroxidase [Persicimonas caeni]|uniref:cytochrome-c peroxidase n=1 Tax=Persicimonas caeni TaxID=2292766 RepID=UPI00143DDB35|nr:cytochrome c peroxidase [Persicimonas caeni]